MGGRPPIGAQPACGVIGVRHLIRWSPMSTSELATNPRCSRICLRGLSRRITK